MTDLATENKTLKHRIECLEFELAEIRGSPDAWVMVGKALGLPRQPSIMLVAMSDGRFWNRERLLVALGASDRSSEQMITVYIKRARKAGLTFKTVWGSGYQMTPESCDRVKALIKGEA